MFHLDDDDSALDENCLIKVLEDAERNGQDVPAKHSVKRRSSETAEEDTKIIKWPRKLSRNEHENGTTEISSCNPNNAKVSIYKENKSGPVVNNIFQIDNGGFEDDLELELELVSTVQNAEKLASGNGSDSSSFQKKGIFKTPILTPQKKQTNKHGQHNTTASSHIQPSENENDVLPTAISFGYENQNHRHKEGHFSVGSNAPNMHEQFTSESCLHLSSLDSSSQASIKENVMQNTPVINKHSARTPDVRANQLQPRLKMGYGSNVSTPLADNKLTRTGGSCVPVDLNEGWTTPRGADQQGQQETPSTGGTGHSSSTKKKQRKFPGPAGILPQLKSGASLENLPVAETTPVRKPIKLDLQTSGVAELPSSQSSEDCFKDSAWTSMVQDLEPQAGKVLQQFCVAAVTRKASRKILPRGKVPAMGLLIETICTQNPDARVMLKDKTGSIGGTIHRQLMKEYPAQFQQGTVLLLRQIGVFSPSAKTHYLNITPNNLVKVYNRGENDQAVCTTLGQLTSEDMTIPPASRSNSQILDDYSSPCSLFMGQTSGSRLNFSTCMKFKDISASNAFGSVQPNAYQLGKQVAGSSYEYDYIKDNRQATQPLNDGGTSPFVQDRLSSTTSHDCHPDTPVSSSSKRFSFRKPTQNIASPVLNYPGRRAVGGNCEKGSTVSVTSANQNIMTAQVTARKQANYANDAVEDLWEDDLDDVMSQMTDDVI